MPGHAANAVPVLEYPHIGRCGDFLTSPAIAHVYQGGRQSIEAIAHPDLEVLVIKKGPKWEGEPLGLAPLARLPKLRTLRADPGTLADPLEIAELTVELGPQD